MERIKEFIINNFTEERIIMLVALGVFLIGLSILIPSKKKLFKIDLIRRVNQDYENLNMSKGIRYLHNLSAKSFVKGLYPKPKDISYKKCEEKIKDAGIQGLTVDSVSMLKYYLFFLGVLISNMLSIALLRAEKINIIGFMSLVLSISIFFFYIPDLYLKNKAKNRHKLFLSELDQIELFIVIFLKAGYNVYDILLIMKDTTVYTAKYFEECANEYYIKRNAALQKLADKINLEEYQLLIDILKQANDIKGEDMVDFIDVHMKQLKKMRQLNKASENKKNPLKYAVVLMLPFLAIILLWIYPLLIEALASFSSIMAY